jgi:hypothetical protein
VEKIVETTLKLKNEAEKALKEKDEDEQMVKHIQMAIQKMYKEIPEVPIIVEATMEEHVSNIGEVIKGFRSKIEDFESHTVPRTPPEEREQRENLMHASFANIKILEQECTRMCDESIHIWTQLIMNPKLKEIEDKIRSTQEKAHQANETNDNNFG